MIQTTSSGTGNNPAATWRLRNPLPELARDSQKFNEIFEKSPAVPYASGENYSAQRTVKLLFALHELSATHKTVVSRKLDFAFGGDMDLQRRKRAGVVGAGGEVGEAEKETFWAFLESIGVSPSRILQVTNEAAKFEAVTGTFFLRLRIARIGNETAVTLAVHSPRDCVRLFDREKPASAISNSVMISEGLATGDFKTFPPDFVPLFPLFKESGALIETVFQVNEKGYESDFYGRPVASMFDLFRDYSQTSTLARISQTEFVARLAMFLENEPSEGDGTDEKNSLDSRRAIADAAREKIQGNGGTPEGLYVHWYPVGGQPPQLQEIAINRDTDFFEFNRSDVRTAICAAHGIDPVIADFERAPNSLGSSMLIKLFAKTNEITIKPYQARYVDFWDKVFAFIFEKTGRENLKAYSLKFPERLKILVKELKSGKGGQSSTIE